MSSPESQKDADSPQDQPAARAGRTRRAPRAQRGSGGASEPAAQTAGGSDRSRTGDAGSADDLFGWSIRDFLIPYVLLALSMQRAHGYFIEQYLHGLGLANVELSTLYRTLRQLEKNGLVSSTWEPGPDGPARRIYSLTDAGRWWLDAGAATLAGYRDIIDRFFGSYTGPTRRRPVGDNGEKGEKGASR